MSDKGFASTLIVFSDAILTFNFNTLLTWLRFNNGLNTSPSHQPQLEPRNIWRSALRARLFCTHLCCRLEFFDYHVLILLIGFLDLVADLKSLITTTHSLTYWLQLTTSLSQSWWVSFSTGESGELTWTKVSLTCPLVGTRSTGELRVIRFDCSLSDRGLSLGLQSNSLASSLYCTCLY